MRILKYFLILLTLILLYSVFTKNNILKLTSDSKDSSHLNSITKFSNLSFNKILFLGMSGFPHPSPFLTDSIILAFIDSKQDQNKIKLVSIPRDTIVYDSDIGDFIKINAIYANFDNGTEKLFKHLEEITGENLKKFVIVDLEVVKDIIDWIGGINIYIEEDIEDYFFPGPNFTYEPFILKRGWRFMDGELASKYLRTRYSKEGDIGRMKRQLFFLRALFLKVKAKTLKNPAQILSIFKIIRPKIKTNISLSDFKELYSIFKVIEKEDILSFTIDLENLMTTKKLKIYGGIQDVLIPKFGLNNFSEIRQYVWNFLNE